MYSMTGFGKGEYKTELLTVTVEMKSVNGKTLDLSVKAPRGFACYEEMIRSIIGGALLRGHVDVFVSYTDKREKSNDLEIDEAIASSYVRIAKALGEKFPDIPNDLTVTSLLKLPDVLRKKENSDDDPELSEAVRLATAQATENILAMRKKEGLRLKKDVLSRLETLQGFVNGVSERAPLVVAKYREDLENRIREYLGQVNYDESKLLTEVALFTDKCNIDEELTRLNSHIAEVRTLCEGDRNGKKLDFLMQECLREGNTICSKANDLAVTKGALNIKNEIEKIKEQVQNLE